MLDTGYPFLAGDPTVNFLLIKQSGHAMVIMAMLAKIGPVTACKKTGFNKSEIQTILEMYLKEVRQC